MADKVTPELSQVGVESTRVTVEDLSNPEHPVNNKGASGKRSGMGLIIQGHLWVAEGPNPDDKWYRVQKHNEVMQAIFRAVGNTTPTTSDGSGSLVTVSLDNFSPVEAFFAGDWTVTPSTGTVTYSGKECVFKFIVSGDITTGDSSGTGDSISVSLYDTSAMDGLTGATKILQVVKVQGGNDSVVDFTLVGYARVTSGDSFSLQVGSDFAGDLLANNILMSIEPMDTLLYI